jgi:Ca2+-binding RTX toxin-like protein
VHGTLYGGDGNDEYWISSPDALIYDLSGTDHVFIASSYELSSRLEDLTLLGGDRIDGTGNASNNEITGNVNRNELLGLDGSDTLSGLGGNDRLDGGSDADSLTGGSGSDYILGGEGSDNDTLNGNSGNDTLLGEGGNDSLFGGDQHDRLLGGEGNDTLVGGSGDDVMLGGSGFDHFYGEAGNDTLTGDFNADTFFFADGFGDDIVTDFDANNDNERIDLHSVTNIVDFADLMANHAAQSGNRVVISDGSDSITLLGVQLADLDAIDFIF